MIFQKEYAKLPIGLKNKYKLLFWKTFFIFQKNK